MLKEISHPSGVKLKITDTPLKLSRTPGGIQGPPPAIGEHTDDVLEQLAGFSADEIARLRERGIIFGPLEGPVGRILEHENRLTSEG
jgi:crotonobetainyl-CoA:carnitine CoA-transferase CaiB-like acyl-CoA transferase